MTTDEPRPDPLQQRVPLAPPVFAPPLAPAEPAVPLPQQTPPASPAAGAPAPRRRSTAVIVLAIACSVLLLATLGLGATTALLLLGGSSTSAPEPSPAPTSTADGTDTAGAEATVQGFPVQVFSDLRIQNFALSTETGVPTLYALVTNTSSNQVAKTSFDITAYDSDDRVIYRTLDLFYLLPDQTSMLDASFLTDIDDLDHFTIEQLDIEWIDPPLTGGATITEARTGGGYVETDLASTLSAVAEYTEVYLAVFVDDKIVGACYDLVDFPASGGTLTASCGLESAWNDDEVDVEDLPADAEVDAFLKIDYSYGD